MLNDLDAFICTRMACISHVRKFQGGNKTPSKYVTTDQTVRATNLNTIFSRLFQLEFGFSTVIYVK